jgi:hypothetical protein
LRRISYRKYLPHENHFEIGIVVVEERGRRCLGVDGEGFDLQIGEQTPNSNTRSTLTIAFVQNIGQVS